LFYFCKPHRSLLCVKKKEDVQQLGLSKEADEVVNAAKHGGRRFQSLSHQLHSPSTVYIS
jgi:hypothetical protein